jgi:hypothetical protein
MRLRGLTWIMAMVVPLTAEAAECGQDVGDLERVVPTLGLSTDLRREAEALQTEAASRCESGDSEGARAKVAEAWQKIIDDDEVTARTVADVAVNPCTEGMAAVEAAFPAGTGSAGAISRDMAQRLVGDAEQLCASGEEDKAQEKLALAWSILQDE